MNKVDAYRCDLGVHTCPPAQPCSIKRKKGKYSSPLSNVLSFLLNSVKMPLGGVTLLPPASTFHWEWDGGVPIPVVSI